MQKKALVNYYARLIRKNKYSMEKVPTDLRSEVRDAIDQLPPYEGDPEIETVIDEDNIPPCNINKSNIGL